VIEILGASVTKDEHAWMIDRLRRAIEVIPCPQPIEPIVPFDANNANDANDAGTTHAGGSPAPAPWPRFARISIRLAHDDEMARLHDRCLGDPTTTDVLTWVERGADGAIEVDLAIGLDEADRHARAHGYERREELLLYAVHGLLHAVGFDDRTPEAFERMHAIEARVVSEIGGRATVQPTDEEVPP